MRSSAIAPWIDEVADRFEAACKSSTPPTLNDFIADATDEVRGALLVELVKLDLAHREILGERRTVEDYAQDFPELLAPDGSLRDSLVAYERQLPARLDEPAESTKAYETRSVASTRSEAAATRSRETGGPGTPPGDLPRQLGRFELRGKLGRGGFGTVFRAWDQRLEREVALKVPRAELFVDASDFDRFFHEARAVAQLAHPNIVPLYEADRVGETCYLASRLVEGRTLQEALAEGRRFTHREAACLIRQLAQALHYAHTRAVIHRDVKPANVMLDNEDTPLLMDFGLARRTESDGERTQEGAVLGTPSYMSPEQASGRSHLADARTDLWSLGVMFYELLCGDRPFEADSHAALYDVIRNREPTPPRQKDKAITRDLDTIVLRCLSKEPTSRYPSCQHLAEELGRWERGEPILARPVGVIERTWRWCCRRPAIAALCAALGLTLMMGFGGILWQWRRAEDEWWRAERNLVGARNVVNEFFTEVSESPELLKGTPGTQLVRKRLLGRAQVYYEQFIQQRSDDETLRGELAAAHSKLAFIVGETGDHKRALKLYQRALEIREPLTRSDPTTVQLRSDLAEDYNNLGMLHLKTGEPVLASAALEKAIEIEERLVSDNSAVEAFASDLAETYSNLGTLEYRTGRLAEALAAHRHALAIRERLARENPTNTDHQNDVASSHDSIAVVHYFRGKPADALASHEKALAIHIALAEEYPDDPERQAALAFAYHNIGTFHYHAGAAAESLAAYEECRKIRQRWARSNPALSEYQFLWAQACVDVGAAHQFLLKNLDASQAEYQQAIDIVEPLVRAEPSVNDFNVILATAYNNLGILSYQKGDTPAALAAHKRALEIQEHLIQNNPDVPEHQDQLATGYFNLGMLLFRSDDADSAIKSIQESLTIREPLAEQNPTIARYQTQLVNCYHNLGTIYRETGRPREAKVALEKAIEIIRRLIREQPSAALENDLAQSYYNLASVQNDLGHEDEALAARRKVIEIREPLVREHPDVIDFQVALALSYIGSALFEARAGHLPRAMPDVEHGVQILERLPPKILENVEYRTEVAESHYTAACVCAVAANTTSQEESLTKEFQEQRTEEHASRAIELLEQARALGWFSNARNAKRFREEDDLAPLHNRDDFRKLLKQIEAAPRDA